MKMFVNSQSINMDSKMKTRYYAKDAFAFMLVIYAVCVGIAYLCVIGL